MEAWWRSQSGEGDGGEGDGVEWMEATVVGREMGVVIGELCVDVGGELMGGEGTWQGREERRKEKV